MKFTAVRTAVFQPRENLTAFIVRHITHMPEKCVLAVASKLFALWKGEILPYENARQKETLIRRESSAALKTPLAWLTVKDGMVMTNAGIDESNADGKLLLLPPDGYALAETLRRELCAAWGIKELGVLVTDSMILPLRAGVTATAVAYAGFKGVRDLRGTPDIFGKPLEVTLVDAADSLAAAAALCMGEGSEQSPLCVIENAPVEFRPGADADEIKYPVENDLYTPLFCAAGLIKKETTND